MTFVENVYLFMRDGRLRLYFKVLTIGIESKASVINLLLKNTFVRKKYV